ncbi:nucleotidyltransferase family protein [Methylobacterium sp. BTF04]|uniref:nucleotidyltransferase family protein n=1 Tax=Methylobacterium sp. BTF04 TaxID=2708300 RepID=UPI0013D1E77C|nr:nucleotidyltransferase family protein [Methylobacterium sp. BTF04]NEU13268.1 nucleotidyltransferase family protein [Methylobacterium sp. BTF04]
MNETQQAHGTIWAVFGHRLAIEGATGKHLADLGPKGAKGLSLKVGDTITVAGEAKPSEIKVATLTFSDGTTHTIVWDKPHAAEMPPADPERARDALRQAGYRIEGEPKRKPKHFELQGIRDGGRFEVHVALDGTIRKAKALDVKALDAAA